jgi:hypothetical protein
MSQVQEIRAHVVFLALKRKGRGGEDGGGGRKEK